MNARYLAGLSLNNNSEIIAWFNNQPFHTTALSLGLAHNAMLKSTLGPEYSIKVSNWPLHFRVESTMSMLMAGNNMGKYSSINITKIEFLLIKLFEQVFSWPQIFHLQWRSYHHFTSCFTSKKEFRKPNSCNLSAV